MAVSFDLSIFMSRVQHLADVLFCPDFNEAFYFLAVPGEPTTPFLCSSGFTSSSAVVGSYSFFFYCFDCAVVNRAHYCPHHYSVSHSYESVVPGAGAFVFSLHRNRYRVRMDASRDHLFLAISTRLFCPASERDCCVHICPNEPDFRGGCPLFRNNCPKRSRCEYTLSLFVLVLMDL